MLKAYIGYINSEFFKASEPQVNEEGVTTLVDDKSDPTFALPFFVIAANIKHEKWKANNDNIRQRLVESL